MSRSEYISKYKNKNVLIVGLGLLGGGVGAAKFLVSQEANVTVTDLRDAKVLKKSIQELGGLPINYILNKHDENSFSSADIVVVNPGVPRDSKYIKIARDFGAEVVTELGIFIKHFPGKVIAVTGTKGKSTTTSIIYNLLLSNGLDAKIGGNIGGSLLSDLNNMTSNTYAVLEISSFQIDWLNLSKFNPMISVLTNMYRDHLDRYHFFEEYKKAKKALFDSLDKENLVVANKDNLESLDVIKDTKARFSFFSRKEQLNNGAFIQDEKFLTITNCQKNEWIGFEDIRVKGTHNVENILAAIAVASILKLDESSVKRGIRNFNGIEHRLEFVRTFKGIDFLNDSASTIPISTIYAIRSFSKPINIIIGGVSKSVDFNPLAKEILKKAKSLHLIGKNREDIFNLINTYKNNGYYSSRLTIFKHGNLENAIKGALDNAKENEVILFSPASASFDLFVNSKERGEKYKNLVSNLN
jgi:UDP-N-acetylmuramoylalanine--D-glutamate ligase